MEVSNFLGPAYKTLGQALAENTLENVFFSQDKDNTGKKQFYRVPISKMVQIIDQITSKNFYLYELIPPDVMIKMFFDCEIERVGITQDECVRMINQFIHWVISKTKEHFSVHLTAEDFIVLNSCRANKLSYHLIVKNKICFKNMGALKQYIMVLNAEFDTAENENLIWRKNGHKLYIFDVLPYKSNQNFRLLGQSKRSTEAVAKTEAIFSIRETNCGNSFILRNEFKANPIETFVRLYNGKGHRLLIDEKMQETIPGKTIKTDKKTSKQIDIDSSIYELAGANLKDKHGLTQKAMLKMPEWKRYLYTIPNTSQPRDIFIHIGYALRVAGGNQADYEEWAKMSYKYTQGRHVQKFNSFLLNGSEKRVFTVEYLKNLALLSNPHIDDPNIHYLDQYYNPDYKTIKIIEEESPFLSQEGTPFENDIFRREKFILLRAFLGRGKTTAIKRIIHKFKRILIISPRVSFGQFISKEFECEFYKELEEKGKKPDLQADRLCISVESIHKIKNNEPYDLVIMDETEAIISVFSSSTNRHQLESYHILKGFIEQSMKTILAGAFITQKTIDYILSFNKPAVCIWNKTPPKPKQAVQLPEDLIDAKLIESIKKGKKLFVVFSTKNKLLQTKLILEDNQDDPNIKHALDNMLIYCDGEDAGIQTYTLTHMSETWGKARLIMTSPTITVGNSYCPDIPDVDEVFIFSYPSCIVADTFQAHMRVRHTKSNMLYFSLPAEREIKKNRTNGLKMINILENRDLYIGHKKEMIYRQIRDVSNETINESLKKQLTVLMDAVIENETPETIKNIIWFNLLENTLSASYYIDMFHHFLKINNYIIIEQKQTVKITELSSYKPQITPLEEIPEAIKDIYELENRRDNKRATKIEQLQIDKHHFERHIDETLNQEQKNHYWEQYKNRHQKHILNNFYSEIHRTDADFITNTELSKQSLETTDCKAFKLGVIHTLNKELGLLNSRTAGVKITRETIEKLNEYLQKDNSLIHTAFYFNTQSKATKWGFLQSFDLIRKIYNHWTGYELVFEVKKDSSKRVLYAITGLKHPEIPPPYSIGNTDNTDYVNNAVL